MATVNDRWKLEPERRGKGKRYQVRYRDDVKGWRRKAFTRKVDAARYAAQIQHQLDQGTFRDPNAGHTPFGEYALGWLHSRVDLATNTHTLYRGFLINHLLPSFGDVPLARLRPHHGRDFVAAFDPTTAVPAKALTLATAILKTAVLDGVIANNPFQHLVAPKTVSRQAQPFNHEELEALLGTIHGHYRCLALSAAVLGARWGELVGLRPGSVDLLHRKVHIKEQLSEASGTPSFAPLKTAASNRTISIPKFLATQLEQQLTQAATSDLVFSSINKEPIRKSNFNRRYWRPAVKAIGLPDRVFHDLRHTAVALAIESDAHPKSIQERLGHANINTTLNVYGHMFPSLDADIADRLDQSMGTTFGVAS